MSFTIFKEMESEVRSYCRSFPAKFKKAKKSILYDTEGTEYIDFFSGAGSVNYGHNDDDMQLAMLNYIKEDGLLQSMDMYSEAKEEFLHLFNTVILKPRFLNYKIQFTGPTGTNAVEAALKLARKITGRHSIACFTGGYHGMSLGALSVTANASKRNSSGLQVPGVLRLPYDGFVNGASELQLIFIEDMLLKAGCGNDLPAAFIVECIQGEGGLNVASAQWLRKISEISKKCGSLLIIDEIQAGCGRSGKFFSFEDSGIQPDIICLSKSLSGSGLPMSVNLISPDHDIWNPGEHNGTFRGNNLAMVTSTVAINKFWKNEDLGNHVIQSGKYLEHLLNNELPPEEYRYSIVGKGLMIGMRFSDKSMARRISQELFNLKMIAETCGPHNEVLKFMPALTIDSDLVDEGFRRIVNAVKNQYNHSKTAINA